MASIETLLTDHLDVWTSAIARKSSAGRGRSRKFSLHGIEKLRSLILDLAVRGKLVPQDPSDESATILLRRFRAENIDWIEKKRMRKGKQLPPVHVEDIRYKAPYGWSWIRLNQLGDWGAGATPNRKRSDYYGGGIPWFKSGELTSDIISISEESVTDLALEECSLRLNRPGDVLIAMYGATIGKTSILAVEATTNQAVCACTPFAGACNRYLLMALKAMRPLFVGQGAGGAQPNISREKIIATAFALPPEAEQHRIVAKVEELMALCDRLEAGTYKAIEAHQLLVTELLATLTASRDAGELAENWARIETHFDTLFVTEDSVDQLKQTILQLAVMGRLVPQDPDDEPASEFLKRIEAAKITAQEQEKPRARSSPSKHGSKGLTFETPRTWETTSFDDVFLIASGVTKGQKITPSETVELPYLRVANVQRGFLDLSEIKLISVKSSDASRYELRRGDILMTEGGDWDKVGRAAIWSGEIEGCIHQNHVFRIRPPSDEIQSEWVINFVNSPVGRDYFQDASKQTTNLASINMTQLRRCPFPVPPLAEQHRIMTRLKELFQLCEGLKSRLADASDREAKIADAVVATAVG